nr:putative reverse transcriptase domain-containing protein [Tanacetum cinerariifolium]
MTKLTQKKVKFDWGEKQEVTFQLLKQKLFSALILALPEGSEYFIVYCDGSIKGLGAVLMQREKKKQKSRSTQRKETEVAHIEPQTEESVPPSGEDRMQLTELINLCTKLSDKVLSLEQNKTNQAATIEKLKKRVKKLEGKKKRTHRLEIMYKVGLSARIVSSDEEGLGDQEGASKQGRIAKIDADENLSLIDETVKDQGRMNEEELFRVNDLDGHVVIVDVTSITTAKDVEVTTAAATT